MSKIIWCECGNSEFDPGHRAWWWDTQDQGPVACEFCPDCGQQLKSDGTLGPTREERDRAQLALAVVEKLAEKHRTLAQEDMIPQSAREHYALCEDDPIAALEAMA